MPKTSRGHSLFDVKLILDAIGVISEREENSYSDIPGFTGQMIEWTDRGILLLMEDGSQIWFPISQLRKADDEQSIYASNWILEQKGL